MKISGLVGSAQVSQETLRCYVQEGLLPKPGKMGKDVADFNESHIEGIRLIKQIQDHFHLSLSLINKIDERPD